MSFHELPCGMICGGDYEMAFCSVIKEHREEWVGERHEGAQEQPMCC